MGIGDEKGKGKEKDIEANDQDLDQIGPAGTARNRGENERLTQDIVVKEGMTPLQKGLFACGLVLILLIVIIVIVIIAAKPWTDTEARTPK